MYNIIMHITYQQMSGIYIVFTVRYPYSIIFVFSILMYIILLKSPCLFGFPSTAVRIKHGRRTAKAEINGPVSCNVIHLKDSNKVNPSEILQ